jgi:hypothetical protein
MIIAFQLISSFTGYAQDDIYCRPVENHLGSTANRYVETYRKTGGSENDLTFGIADTLGPNSLVFIECREAIHKLHLKAFYRGNVHYILEKDIVYKHKLDTIIDLPPDEIVIKNGSLQKSASPATRLYIYEDSSTEHYVGAIDRMGNSYLLPKSILKDTVSQPLIDTVVVEMETVVRDTIERVVEGPLRIETDTVQVERENSFRFGISLTVSMSNLYSQSNVFVKDNPMVTNKQIGPYVNIRLGQKLDTNGNLLFSISPMFLYETLSATSQDGHYETNHSFTQIKLGASLEYRMQNELLYVPFSIGISTAYSRYFMETANLQNAIASTSDCFGFGGISFQTGLVFKNAITPLSVGIELGAEYDILPLDIENYYITRDDDVNLFEIDENSKSRLGGIVGVYLEY